MKNIFIAFILFLVVFQSCKEDKESSIKKENTSNRVSFKIDERIELLRIAFNLAVEDVTSQNNLPCQTEYAKKTSDYFKSFKSHPLVSELYENDNVMFDFPTIGLMFDDLDDLNFNSKYYKELKSFRLSKTELDSLKPLIKDFYLKSDFKTFFNSNRGYYKKAISNLKNQVKSEAVFDSITKFYQSDQQDLELIVFVDLTNNVVNKAVSFYDNYNPSKRAIVLANLCNEIDKPNKTNKVLVLNNDVKRVLYHETSHLFTSKLLDKYVDDLNQYRSLCKDCNDIQLKDKIDHLIVIPLQAVLQKRLNNDNEGHDYFISRKEDIRKEIYLKLQDYNPNNSIPFEKIYKECIDLIKKKCI